MDLTIGSRIEVEADGDWWNATVVGLTTEEVQVHFDGGTEEEDEWIFLTSRRLRECQDDDDEENEDDDEENFELELDVLHEGSGVKGTSKSPRKEKKMKTKGRKTTAGKKTKSKTKGKDGKTKGAFQLPSGWSREERSKGRWTYVAPDGAEFTNFGQAMAYHEETRGGMDEKGKKKAEKKSTGGKAPVEGKKRKRDEPAEEDEPEVRGVMPKHGGAFDKAVMTHENKWLYQERFDPVRLWLLQQQVVTEDEPKWNNNEFLARVTDIIHHSQHLHLGVNAVPDKRERLVRLPQSIFLDKSAGGGLCLLLKETIAFMRKKGYSTDGLERTMFKQVEEREFTHMRLFETIHTRLLDKELIVYPCIYFTPELVRSISKSQLQHLQSIATSHKATIALEEADATHVIVPDSDGMISEPGSDYCRTLALRTSKKSEAVAYVHWWFHPDSYDEWLLQSIIMGDVPEKQRSKSGVFRVCVRWLNDTDVFNEWMNEEDYEPDDDSFGGVAGSRKAWTDDEYLTLVEGKDNQLGWPEIAALLGRKETAVKAKWQQKKQTLMAQFGSGSATATKKMRAESSKGVKTTGGQVPGCGMAWKPPGREEHKGKGKGVEKREKMEKTKKGPTNRLLSATEACWEDEEDLQASLQAEPITWDLPPLSEYKAALTAAAPVCNEEEMVSGGSGGVEEDAEPQAPLDPGPPLLLPQSCSWFSLESVNQRERDMAPEYFNQSSDRTEEGYVWHRNAIVGLWCYRMAEWATKAVSSEDAITTRGGKNKCSKKGKGKKNANFPPIHVPPPPKLALSECLTEIPGISTDLARVFQALSHLGIINSDCFKEVEVAEEEPEELGHVEAAKQRLAQTFRQYGTDWGQVSMHVQCGSRELCMLAFASMAMHTTPLIIPALAMPEKALLPRVVDSKPQLASSEDRALRAGASLLQASVGVVAAAAGAELCMNEEKKRLEGLLNGAGVETNDVATRSVQLAGCRGAMMVAMTARAKILARREMMEVRSKAVSLAELQMIKIQEKLTTLLVQKKELAKAHRLAAQGGY